MSIYRTILKGIWITEKSVRLSNVGQYVFEVDKNTTKNEIKKAVVEQYKVHPIRVNIINRPAKKRGLGKVRGSGSALSKAVVTLKKGEKIDVQ